LRKIDSSSPGSPENRRGNQRWSVEIACRVRVEETEHRALILDLSEEGAYIQVKEVPPEGESVSISIYLDGEKVELEGVVVHGGRYRLRFSEVTGFGVRLADPPREVIKDLQTRFHLNLPASVQGLQAVKVPLVSKRLLERILEVNREIWLVLSMLVILGLINFLVVSDQMILSLYTLPTLGSAYLYGRRHAVLTASASIFLVILTKIIFGEYLLSDVGQQWQQITIWGGTLVIIVYAMGSLCDRLKFRVEELRQTYNGVLLILQQFISKDDYTQNHSYRVSVYAVNIGAELRLDEEEIEDIRAAALLHDVGKLEVSREILYKAAKLTDEEYEEMKTHIERGVSMLSPVGGSLRRVIPIVLSHHDRFDGSGESFRRAESIPLAARIIAVADVFDAVTSDRPYRKAMSPYEAKEMIVKGKGTDFDPAVVDAFEAVFLKGGMEVPHIVV
jgi:HD-GYP domain-containing protein (c-di-GMP phosphodiesterase class II)